MLGGVPGLGCSATLSAACAATHFGVECKEEDNDDKEEEHIDDNK